MDRRQVALSKRMAHALRHAPERYGLTLDDAGWAPVAVLVAALRTQPRWRTVDADEVAAVVRDSPKQRFEVRDDRIRARYGHSVPQRLTRQPAQPPAVLYHGTAPGVVATVLRHGLRPMSRQHVHLSVDVATAVAVGVRKAPAPVVLRVDAAGAGVAGVVFYRGNEHVWLADAVPGRFLRPLA